MPDQELIDKIRVECKRVQLLIPIYESIVPSGKLARDLLEIVLHEAETSVVSGDTTRMKRALESLRDVK